MTSTILRVYGKKTFCLRLAKLQSHLVKVIALFKPTLNEQKAFEIVTVFRNGVT